MIHTEARAPKDRHVAGHAIDAEVTLPDHRKPEKRSLIIGAEPDVLIFEPEKRERLEEGESTRCRRASPLRYRGE